MICTTNSQKKGGFYNQRSRISYYRIEKTLEKMIILSAPRLNNLIAIVIGIIFDHTTIDDRFVILQFSLKVGRRAIPLWFKLLRYKQDGNKDFIHVKEGLKFLHKILNPYNFDVTILEAFHVLKTRKITYWVQLRI